MIDNKLLTDSVSRHKGKCLVLADDKCNGAYLGELVKLRIMPMGYRFIHICRRGCWMIRPDSKNKAKEWWYEYR